MAARNPKTALCAAAAWSFLAVAALPAYSQTPLRLGNAQIEPLSFGALDGWTSDDHVAAFSAFKNSCKAILSGSKAMRRARPVYNALFEVCGRASDAPPTDEESARIFFERNFRPVKIAPLGETLGFFTGYYEAIAEGARFPSYDYTIPIYRKPAKLVVAGARQPANFPSSGAKVGRLVGKRGLVPYHDRTAIEEGAIAGRGLEICWLKDPIDAFFAQIQGSARIKLDTGETLRVNYDAHNGLPYYPVGKWLIERGYVSKEEMSMDRIRDWMNAHPEEGKELRRKNRSYVFFRETGLGDNDEPIGAQGIPLTPGRSLAVDKRLHVYGTPIWIEAEFPIKSEKPETPFRRLLIAQDTGSAIVGPARADIYFGSGEEEGHIAGRIKQFGRFVMLVPSVLEIDHTVPLPRPRPNEITDGEAEVEVEHEEPTAAVAAAGPIGILPPAKVAPAETADVPLPKPRPKSAGLRT